MAAGSLARLLKIQIQSRGPAFSTFVDTDNLTDLAQLFGLVSHQVQTLVVLASSEILRRKWCVGEMATAHMQKVDTVLVVLPGFVKPATSFIDNYLYIVPDIKDLANYNIGLRDVQSSLDWLRTLDVLELPSIANPEAIDDVVTRLTAVPGTNMRAAATESTDCVIIADPDNLEAMSTAYVLFAMLSNRMIKETDETPPGVLVKNREVPAAVSSVLLICSQNCLDSAHIARWILQTSQVEACIVLPIIAEDSFQFPSNACMTRMMLEEQLQTLDRQTYIRLVRCIFEEVAISFSARASSASELDLRLDQVVLRLRTSRPRPLAQKYLVEVEAHGDGLTGSSLLCHSIEIECVPLGRGYMGDDTDAHSPVTSPLTSLVTSPVTSPTSPVTSNIKGEEGDQSGWADAAAAIDSAPMEEEIF